MDFKISDISNLRFNGSFLFLNNIFLIFISSIKKKLIIKAIIFINIVV